MTVSTGGFLKSYFDQTNALGAKVISSDFTFAIDGYEDRYLLCKQAPWPELSPQGEIEIPTPLGGKLWQPQQINTALQGQVTFYETVAGTIDAMIMDILANSSMAHFNARIYEGTPEKYLCYKRIEDCFLQFDLPDRDWENRSQPLTFSGTLFFHYFGERVEGNSRDYR